MAFAVMMALALHLPKEGGRKQSYHTEAQRCLQDRRSFIPLWDTWAGESDRHTLLFVFSDQMSIFGCADVCICMGTCVYVYVGLYKDLGLSEYKY